MATTGALTAAMSSASAATLTWNGDGSGAGTGTWDLNTTINWLNLATPVAWTANNAAAFAGTDGLLDGYVVSLAGGSLNPTTMAFNNTGYILTAPSATSLTLQTAGTASVNNLTVASGKTATVGSNVAVGTPAGSGLTIGGGGTLNVGTSDGNSTAASVLTNSANIAQGNNLTINASTVNVYAGGTLATSGIGGGSFVVGSVVSTTSILNVEGGSVVAVKDPSAGNEVTGSLVVANANGTTATLNIDSGTVTLAANSVGSASPLSQGGLRLGPQSAPSIAATATVNLNGGTLTAPRIFAGSTGANSTEVFNFNGGILQANKSDSTPLVSTFMAGLNTANVRNGGAKIDTNGFDITIAQALLHSAIPGDNSVDGGLIKSGAGALTLSGASTFTGDAFVTAGNLAIAGALNGTGNLTISTGATLELRNNLSLNDEITLSLANHSTFNLNFSSGTEFVQHLTLDGTPVNDGIYTVADLMALNGSITFLGAGSLGVGAVPEPTTWALLFVGAGSMFWIRRSLSRARAQG